MTRKAGAPGTAGEGYRGLVHVTDEDCSVAAHPTAAQARAIALLELNPDGHQMVRLTVAQWRHVDRVVVQLDEMHIPSPRIAGDDPAVTNGA